MAKIVLSEELGHKLLEKKIIVEDTFQIDTDPYLKPEYRDDPAAIEAIRHLIGFLDIINNSEIDQSEGGMSDYLRGKAIQMLNANR